MPRTDISAIDRVDADDVAESALSRLRRLVTLESPSHDERGLRELARVLAADLEALGADVDMVDLPGVGDNVVARLGDRAPASEPGDPGPTGRPAVDPDHDGRPGGAARAPVVVLGHLDTVHPVGSFDPVFRVREGRAEGPGVFDMKGGLACMLEAIARLQSAGSGPARPLIVLVTCDEETGADGSRSLIEGTVAGARAVLVPEPPLPEGAAKTRRKGVGWYRVEVHGRAAHAGLAPGDGVNAVVELAHRILAVMDLAEPELGTTVTVGQAGGGTAPNVVPAAAWAAVDVRFRTPAEGDRVDAALRALEPSLAGARVVITGGINRPPMERTPAVAELYERARALAERDGWRLGEGESGGASDGSLAAALGIPTLDGIGPAGGGAHAADEHVLVEDLPRRVALYARLLETL